jgi:hypothetical protein
VGTRFSKPRPADRLWSMSLVLLATAGCSLWPSGPLDGESLIPERGLSPWLVAPLKICLDDDCNPEVGAGVQSVDLRLASGRIEVVAALPAGLYLGVLDPAGRLSLSSPPVVTATETWQASGLVDPTWLVTAGSVQILYATADGTALGGATLGPDAWVDKGRPWTTAATLGVSAISGPTAMERDGRVLVLFASDDGIEALSGGDLAPRGLVLSSAETTTARWQSVDRIQDPSLTTLADGSLGLFFAARGRLATSDRTAATDFSIGFAGSADGESFEPYAGNPVHDQVSSLILHADELAPTVVFDGRRGFLLCSSQRGTARSLSLAIHEPR